MSKSGVIVIVEEDIDDRNLLAKIFDELGLPNELKWFEAGEAAMEYLTTTFQSIFVIISDVNLSGQSGLEFKRNIDADPELRRKSIPFIFYSTLAKQEDVNEAYVNMTIQGFFKKGSDYESIKQAFSTIFDYWRICIHPNTQ